MEELEVQARELVAAIFALSEGTVKTAMLDFLHGGDLDTAPLLAAVKAAHEPQQIDKELLRKSLRKQKTNSHRRLYNTLLANSRRV